MFVKAYKLKSNNTLKNSEKKHLAQRILNDFPAATDEKVKDLVPIKSNSSCMKLILHSGETVGVYVVDGVPVMIETSDLLIPTVCALWKLPDLLPTLIIHSPVLPKLAGGAPLYAPGVNLGDPVIFPTYPRGALVAAATVDNGAVGAVGQAAISSSELLRTNMGVCMEPLQVFGDLLCKEPKFMKIERPKLEPPVYSQQTYNITANIAQLKIQAPVKEEWPSLVKEDKPVTASPTPSTAVNEPTIIPDPEAETIVNEESELDRTSFMDNSQVEEDPIPTDMDELLKWCLLSFIKLESKTMEFPLKTNLLYKNHLIALCPPDRTLDVKKSSYKKMGKFLEAMQQEGLLEVREVEKGVSALVSVASAHPALKAHRAPKPAAKAHSAGPSPPVVRVLYCITANVANIFAPLRKGTALSAAEVRSTLTEYVKARGLDAQQRGALTLDPLLAKVTGHQEHEVMKWEELMNAVLNKMTPSTELQYPDGTVKIIKSKLEPIKMQVATRSGNKKVTLVSNLESYGFNLLEMSKMCQHGVAASCGVTRSPGAKYDQLMVQGDQTHFIAKLLIEKYGLPKKYLEGAEKALNKKK